MTAAAQLLILLITLLHLWIMSVEMLFWDKPLGMKMFANTPERARQTKVLAQNQGIYNGFLAAGLIWSLLDAALFAPLAAFFLSCVAVAGIVGALTASRKILFVQTLPALAALALLYLGRS